jgi:DNA-binding transcriptional ArsR family regulator
MTYAKKEKFPRRFQEISSFAKALSHPARLVILDLLAKEGKVVSGDICERIPLSRETVSHHLQELVKAGMIRGEAVGHNVFYLLRANDLLEMENKFHYFLWELVGRTITNDEYKNILT